MKPDAATIWEDLEAQLDDRGCFNGIDEDVMGELRNEMIARIKKLIDAAAE